MNYMTLISVKILFILGFTLHNLEEALWLPKWSTYAKKFHKPVNPNEFIFADIVITLIGYLLTAFDLIYGSSGNIINLLYLGFVSMMGLNSFFPHLAATIVLKKYSPGLITGIFLNLLFSIIIIREYIIREVNIIGISVSMVVVSTLVLLSLKPLFKMGNRFINY